MDGAGGGSLPTRERELKQAPLGGGNVEGLSLPTRERELKRRGGGQGLGLRRSLPTRERELKLFPTVFFGRIGKVAPYTGA